MEERRKIQDMMTMDGWNVYKLKVEEEKKKLHRKMERIRIEDRDLKDVGADYVKYMQQIKGLSRAISIAEEYRDNS